MARNVNVGKRVYHKNAVKRIGKCRKCGCTDRDACVHPDRGACFWVNAACDLCSHCQMGLDCGKRDSQISAEVEVRVFEAETEAACD